MSPLLASTGSATLLGDVMHFGGDFANAPAEPLPEHAFLSAHRRQIGAKSGPIHAIFERVVEKIPADIGLAESEILRRLPAIDVRVSIQNASLNKQDHFCFLAIGLLRAKECAEERDVAQQGNLADVLR